MKMSLHSLPHIIYIIEVVQEIQRAREKLHTRNMTHTTCDEVLYMGRIDALWTAKGIKALTWLQTPQFRLAWTSSIALRLRVHLLDGKCKVNVYFRTIHIDCTASNDTLVHAPHSRRTFAANRSVQPRAPNPLAAVPDRDSLSFPSHVQSRVEPSQRTGSNQDRVCLFHRLNRVQ